MTIFEKIEQQFNATYTPKMGDKTKRISNKLIEAKESS